MDRRQNDRRLQGNRDLYVLDIAGALQVLNRRKWLLAFLFLLIAIPATLYVLFRPNYYVAQATVLLEDPNPALSEFQNTMPKQQTLNDLTIATQLKVITSPTLVHETLDKLAKEENPPKIAVIASKPEARYDALRSFLHSMLVTNEGKSRLISISYKAEDPYEAAKIANAHTEQYVDFQLRSKKEQISQVNDWITEQVAALREDSKKKAQTIQEFRKESGIVLGKNSQELIQQQIADLTAQLIPVETEKLNLQSRADTQGATKETVGSPLITTLKTQLSEAQQELRSLKATYGPQHPEVLAAQNRVKQASADLGRETGSVRTSVKTELESVTEQENLIRTRLEELNKQMDDLREKAIAIESLEAEEAANRTLLESFLTRSEELKTQLSYNTGDVRIASPAETPTQPIGMPKIMLLVLAAIFSAVFATGMVLLLELVDRGIEDPEDIKKLLSLRLIGTLPKTRNPLAEIGKTKSSAYLEDLKRIYLALSQKKAAQCILMTAARSGEGKTTISLTLARYLASIGTRTILIDANTTSPSIAALTEAAQAPGLAELLGGAADLAKVVQKDEDGLAIITAGNQQGYGIDILSSSDRLAKAIDTLKTQYEFVIIDCAPVLNTTDAEIIAGIADQVVLVVEHARVPKKYLNKVAVTLRQFAKETPSVILNKLP